MSMPTPPQGFNVNDEVSTLALAARTDLAVLQLSGSVIENCGDHLIIRSWHPGRGVQIRERR